jgi:hypothetical protein
MTSTCSIDGVVAFVAAVAAPPPAQQLAGEPAHLGQPQHAGAGEHRADRGKTANHDRPPASCDHHTAGG